MKKNLQMTGKLLYKYRFFWQKFGIMLLTLALTTVLVFFVLLMTPGDVVYNYALTIQATQRVDYEYAYKLATQTLHWDPDANFFVKFGDFLESLMGGQFGVSIYNESITGLKLITEKLPWTLFISTIALLISFVLGTTLGAIMARKRNSPVEAVGNAYIMLASAVPDYLIGLLLLIVLSYKLRLFPSNGHYDAALVEIGFNLPFIINVAQHAFLPILTYVVSGTCGWMMLMRSNVVGILGEDYILCAKARGIPERTIISKYMKKSAMLPLITSVALTFAGLFGGSALIESVFNYPGLGLEFSNRVGLRDYFVMAGLLFFTSSIVIIANFITDCLYSVIDPRVRRSV